MIKTFLFSRYEFRLNLLRNQTEFRSIPFQPDAAPIESAGSAESADSADSAESAESADSAALPGFLPVTVRDLNTFYWQLQNAGVEVHYKDMERLLNSTLLPQYHPFSAWFEALPEWDGHDRIGHLARRVSRDALWARVFGTWLRAMVAQWLGYPMQAANSMVPVLVSERQGLGKSTFCRQLLPPALSSYYLDKLDFSQTGEYDRMMTQFGLINLDEIDHFTPRAMSKFKAATQMQEVFVHSAQRLNLTQATRLASFIGTTNQRGVLHDRTGSRRFFCVEVERPIPNQRPINYEQLYAQVLQQLRQGGRTWFDKSEEAQIQRHNANYYALTPLQQALLACYRVPEPDDAPTTLTARDLYRELLKRRPSLVAGRSFLGFSREVAQLYPAQGRGKRGHSYLVVPLPA